MDQPIINPAGYTQEVIIPEPPKRCFPKWPIYLLISFCFGVLIYLFCPRPRTVQVLCSDVMGVSAPCSGKKLLWEKAPFLTKFLFQQEKDWFQCPSGDCLNDVIIVSPSQVLPFPVPSGIPCQVKGKVYQDGEAFPDDCNSCSCESGQIVCTLIACLETKEACLQQGGLWQAWGLMGREYCQIPAVDAGKACTDNSQCSLNKCVAVNGASPGECQTFSAIFGCNRFIQNGIVDDKALCTD